MKLKERTVTWYKNENKMTSCEISERLVKKDLFPTLIMFDGEDTVEMI